MNSSPQIMDNKSVLPALDGRAFLRLSVQQRRDLLELQAIGEAIYTPDSAAMEWLEQTDNLS